MIHQPIISTVSVDLETLLIRRAMDEQLRPRPVQAMINWVKKLVA